MKIGNIVVYNNRVFKIVDIKSHGRIFIRLLDTKGSWENHLLKRNKNQVRLAHPLEIALYE